MSDDVRFERLLAGVLSDLAPTRAPDGLVPDILAAAGHTRRRPRWLALATERPVRGGGGIVVGSPTVRFATLVGLTMLVAVVALAALIAGGVIRIQGDLPIDVRPNPIESPSVDLTPAPTLPHQIAYHRVEVREEGEDGCDPPGVRPGRCYRTQLWVSDVDGTNPRQPFPEMLIAEAIAWAPDGSVLLFNGRNGEGDSATYLSDLSPAKPQPFEIECAAPCLWNAGLTFSPDGRRIAFVRAFNHDPQQADPTESVIATMDLATGRVFELDSTRVDLREGSNWNPAWSPDGSRLVFVANGNKFLGGSPNALFTVDADGSNLREIVPAGLGAEDPRWSPDGTLIAFSSNGLSLESADQHDLYTVRPDGTGVRRLTSDGVSRGATWTTDGRIVFIRTPPADGDAVAVEVWIMGGDGGQPARLDADSPDAMTTANCVSCPYPLADLTIGLAELGEFPNALWQPTP
jgi:Tol biopolymer transport system component